MNLINIQTLEYPITIYEIRSTNPNISYPNSIDYVPDGYAIIEPTLIPNYNQNTQKIIESSPELSGGVWKQVWKVVELSEEEKQKIQNAKANEVRKQRNLLLMYSDWTQLPDATVDQDSWKIYRQELRSITEQEGFPFDVVWPDPPGSISSSPTPPLK
jgi:hypothetical protein